MKFYRPRLSEEEYKAIISLREKNGARNDVYKSNLALPEEDVKQRSPIQRRLFFDIETGYYILKIRSWSSRNFNKYLDHMDIEKEKEILCASWKWEGEDIVHRADYRNGEKIMLEEILDALNSADEIVAHNGLKFDIPFTRTRCVAHRLPMRAQYKVFDTLPKTKNNFLFFNNKLDYLSRFTGSDGKLRHEGFDMWKKVVEEGDMEALDAMGEYCDVDVIELEDYFQVIRPYVTGISNFSTMFSGEKHHCPECGSPHVSRVQTVTTPMGTIQRLMECDSCKVNFKISNKSYQNFVDDQSKIS